MPPRKSSASEKQNKSFGAEETPAEQRRRFKRTKEVWTAITGKAMQLRDKEREFHGFQGELRRYGEGLKDQYEKSKAIKHVRDLGAHREELLKIVLSQSGLIPNKYGMSTCSARVVSKSGHSSKELDLLFYDFNNNIILRKFGDTLAFYPTETVLGVVQIKSNLTYREIDSAFDNIASYKRLYRFKEKAGTGTEGRRGFGIIFAYSTDLSHEQIHARIKSASEKYDTNELPNSIVILGGSVFRFGDDDGGYLLNVKVDNVSDLKVWGDTDIMGDAFYRFYVELTILCNERRVRPINVEEYYDLPHAIGRYSYRFRYGVSAETAKCPDHGEYVRRLSEDAINKIYAYCRDADPIHWLKAIDLARGDKGDNIEAYERQPGEVVIYNPNQWPLDKILMSDAGGLIYDDLVLEGMNVWVPWVYDAKEHFFSGCPECAKLVRRTRLARPGTA
ncbi:DUF6602 domain-containing protein [Methylobacterium radiotolerans]|uniref:DUF6602 domain-containing protein n=1 Tax=Methylobacterium radiotolerans (strain ATCC 27329 / DSM 1819 / JCM 2831 / NBRC 15690 / NCIMB 10815 / 0-1) TaxID=426355 RepID=B1LW77_METRJ|nr:DUF6602 domain-containing protein [Methylobacterium radiotolerans]ACB27140.1 hypothetical protein Mrad2831_5183 [Methylobacterium radiotolerans JCM 2831]GEM98379.1 hypothetical protein MRA01_29190 [Methylobacterium radiotolerans]